MSATIPDRSASGRPRAGWFGSLGGAVAWLVHLLAAYAIGEFGCFAGLDRSAPLGISVVAWMVIAVSVAMTLVALAATGVAYRHDRALRDRGPASDTGAFLARSGAMTSGLFVFIIVVESVPILYFLKGC